MTKLISVYIFALSLLFVQVASADCSCSPGGDYGNKEYQLFEKTWYGTKRHWSCEYECISSAGVKQLVKGTYKDWYTSDEGLEGICEGLVYKNEYNQYKGWFVWMLVDRESFNPKKSSSPEIKSWARQNCQ